MYEWQELYAYNEKSNCVDMKKLEGRFTSKAQALHYLAEYGPILSVKSVGYLRIMVTVKDAGRFGHKRFMLLGRPVRLEDINPFRHIDKELNAA